MLRKPDEDLFESSKMSFGEHLDELRGALIRVVAALAVGVIIGFLPWVGPQVVRFIQQPLQKGLMEFRGKQARAEHQRDLDRREDAGEEDIDQLSAEGEQRLDGGYVPKRYFLDPDQLAEALRGQGYQIDEPPANPAPEAESVGEESATENLLPFTLWQPLVDDPRTRTIGTGVPDAFMVYVKAALLVGVVLSSPFVFYFLWSFVASGLYAHERKYVYIFMPFSLGLFLFGAAVAFFLALGYVLDTLFWFYGWLEIDPTPRIGEWLNFALLLPIGFGIGFQLPLVMLFLERIGVVSVEQYKKSWRIGVLVIAIASMVLTPSDWQSMVLLAVPMTGLYFGGIFLCQLMPRRTTPFGEAMG